MKAWRGRKRIAKKLNPDYFNKPNYREFIDYLLNAKKGDIFHACTGYNHRIEEVEFEWVSTCETPIYVRSGRRFVEGRGAPRSRTRIICGAIVTDDEGRHHYFPGGGCLGLPKSREAIENYFRSWDCPEGWERIKEWDFKDMPAKLEVLRQGKHIVDELGLKIPIE